MRSDDQRKLSRAEEEKFGLPSGLKFLSPFPFGGINQQSSRMAVPDQEGFWIENYIKLGDGYLRTIGDVGPPLYHAAGKKIVSFSFFNIGQSEYVAIWLNDGTGIQVNVTTGAETAISAVPNTFYVASASPDTGFFPATVQWGSLYLLIANNNTPNDYWAWDGTLLYTAGTVAPDLVLTDSGTGYTSAPTVTAYGGHGSGIVIVATVSEGSVVALNVTNPGTGYQPGDQVQLAFSGGGSDTSAQLTAVTSGDTIQSIVVTVPGTGYSTAPAITFTGGGGGTGAAAHAILGSGITAGQVVDIVVDNAGSGYASSPTVVFTGGGFTSAASALAILNPGAVTAVNVDDGGTGYTGTPTLRFVGGGGTGATATAVMSGGVIASVTVNNPGSGYVNAPAVVVQTAVNAAAAGNVTLMPFGISGTSIETYDSQVWLQFPYQPGATSTGGIRNSSAPGSISDFATSDGALSETNTDRFLRQHYIALRQSNGYLYPFGDSSVNVISNVQVSGSPTTKTLNNQNTDPQTGTHWRDTLQDFSRTILFSNPFGVYGLYGGAVTKISGKVDNIFDDADLPGNVPPDPTTGPVTPTAAVANLFNTKVYMQLMTLRDPFSGGTRNAMVAWNEREWFIFSQTPSLRYIGTQEVNSELTAWGTDGDVLYPLMQTPSAGLRKIFSSKLWGAQDAYKTKLALGFYIQAENFADETQAPAFNLIVDTEYASFPNSTSPQLAFPPAGTTLPAGTLPAPEMSPLLACKTDDIVGQQLGFTVVTNAADHGIYNMVMAYQDAGVIFG